MTQPTPPDDDGPPPEDDDAPDAPPKKRKRKPKVVPIRLSVELPQGEHWRLSIKTKADGSVSAKEPGNAALFMAHDDRWRGSLGYDEFEHRAVWLKPPPPLEGLPVPTGPISDTHAVYIQQWFASVMGLTFSMESVHHAIAAAAMANSFHPVRDWLRSLRWDGVQRLPKFLSTYFGAHSHNPEYLAQVGIAWMISGVARIMRPGCKVDHMLVLCGAQGSRKSSGLSELFGADWFSDSPLDIGSAEAAKKLQGKWGIEIPELDAFRGRASSQIKAFLTAQIDRFRASYGRYVHDYPRTNVFAGTTNEREFLGDRTGNRRFWPIQCGSIDRPAIRNDREQLWAEALARYDSNEVWWLTDETLARNEQRTREFREPWFELISRWLENQLVPAESGGYTRHLTSEGIAQADFFRGALSLRPIDMNREAQTRLGFVLQKLGFERRRRRTENGREYAYFRDGPTETTVGPEDKP